MDVSTAALWWTIIGVVVMLATLGVAVYTAAVSRDPNPWRVERIEPKRYSITRTGLRRATIVAIEVTHEGPPARVTHASGELPGHPFAPGRKENFQYGIDVSNRELYVDFTVGRSKKKRTWRTILD